MPTLPQMHRRQSRSTLSASLGLLPSQPPQRRFQDNATALQEFPRLAPRDHTRQLTGWTNLLGHHLIDPDARYEGIALCHLLCVFKAAGAHDREAGDRFGSQRQLPGSGFRDFSTTAEMTPHVDDIVFHRLEPLTPGCHDFWRGLFKSVVQQNKLLHDLLLALVEAQSRDSPNDLRRIPAYVAAVTPRLRSARSNSCGNLRTRVAEPLTLARFAAVASSSDRFLPTIWRPVCVSRSHQGQAGPNPARTRPRAPAETESDLPSGSIPGLPVESRDRYRSVHRAVHSPASAR